MLRQAPRPEAALAGELFFLRRRLAGWHLPQGAPTSPALANLTCFGLDVRLQALGTELGASYSRYADDLVFSGATGLPVGPLARTVAAICRSEGFRVNAPKTRVMRAHRRQEVTGLVVNEGLTVPRRTRDELEAQLFNLARGRWRETDAPPALLRALWRRPHRDPPCGGLEIHFGA